jgi:hypothetical protein
MKPSGDTIREVYTPKKIIWSGCVELRDEIEKCSLWLLLLRHALHEKPFGKGEEEANW